MAGSEIDALHLHSETYWQRFYSADRKTTYYSSTKQTIIPSSLPSWPIDVVIGYKNSEQLIGCGHSTSPLLHHRSPNILWLPQAGVPAQLPLNRLSLL